MIKGRICPLYKKVLWSPLHLVVVTNSFLCQWIMVLHLQEHPLLKRAISSLFQLLGLFRVNAMELDQFKKNLIDEGFEPL